MYCNVTTALEEVSNIINISSNDDIAMYWEKSYDLDKQLTMSNVFIIIYFYLLSDEFGKNSY